jgi:hypothetical protein
MSGNEITAALSDVSGVNEVIIQAFSGNELNRISDWFLLQK